MGKTIAIYLICFAALSCRDDSMEKDMEWIPLKVTATAYNSVPNQTSSVHPKITAWGDSIKPSVKWIAVSRDLLKKGLSYNTMVKIDSLAGIYLVKDKMHHRWLNRIDIYMGTDVQKAKEWGRKKLTIHYGVKKDSNNEQ